jgi:hypothetical protein
MTDNRHFRLLTPDGLVSQDTFVLAPQQPAEIKPGCIAVVNQQSGARLTVHTTRLLPAEDPAPPTGSLPVDNRRSICHRCGRVEGIVQDQVKCPHQGEAPCGLLEAK